jgi:hypothetical protein
MRPDPGRALQEAAIKSLGVEARQAERLRLKMRGLLLAWQQTDEARLTTDLERAEFLLHRLYPTMPDQALWQIMEQLALAEASGNWHGFQRPDPLPIR